MGIVQQHHEGRSNIMRKGKYRAHILGKSLRQPTGRRKAGTKEAIKNHGEKTAGASNQNSSTAATHCLSLLYLLSTIQVVN
eukprot:scaffold2330_cov59-Cylindrotheca_fusiformis.AAC.1